MRKLACILALTLALNSVCKARLSGGISWGYSPKVFYSQVFSYTPNRVGYRISERNQGFTYFSNAYLDLNAGIDFKDKVSLHFKTGYRGAGNSYDIVPLLLESRYYFGSSYSGGSFLALEAGTAMHEWSFEDGIIIVKTAFGYREQLYKRLSVDFTVHLQAMHLHPLPVDKYEGVISRPQVYYSVAGFFQIGFGVGINF